MLMPVQNADIDSEWRISFRVSLFLNHEKITKTISMFTKTDDVLQSQCADIFTFLLTGV